MKERTLSKLMGLAINDYGMIDDGDNIIVGISGGADSIALLMLLLERLKRIPIHYYIYPVIVDIFGGNNEKFNDYTERLKEFINNYTDIGLAIIKTDTYEHLLSETSGYRNGDTCFLCSKKKRNLLFEYAFKKEYNKVALGHHKDDIVETALMNMFYMREISTMIPRLSVFDGKIDLIRPLAYIEKKSIEKYIAEINAPVFKEYCPSNYLHRELRREKVKETVKTLSKEYKNLKNNIFASLRNPKNDYLLSVHYQPNASGIHKRP